MMILFFVLSVINFILLIGIIVGIFAIIQDINSFVSYVRNEQEYVKSHISEEIKKLSKEIVIKNVLNIP